MRHNKSVLLRELFFTVEMAMATIAGLVLDRCSNPNLKWLKAEATEISSTRMLPSEGCR